MTNNRRFEWNAAKARTNKQKHGVSFELAMQVFADALIKVEFEGYDRGEERWRAIGEVGGKLLIVSYTACETQEGENIRIISARRAQSRERRRYERDS
jgi:uncharacterized protein